MECIVQRAKLWLPFSRFTATGTKSGGCDDQPESFSCSWKGFSSFSAFKHLLAAPLFFSSSECCAACRAGGGGGWLIPVGYPKAAAVSTPTPTPYLLRTCVGPGCKSRASQYFMSIKYFIHFVLWQVRLWNGKRSNVFGFSSWASEFHRSWFLRWYVIAITLRFLKCI